MPVEAGVLRFLPVALLPVARERDERDALMRRIRLRRCATS